MKAVVFLCAVGFLLVCTPTPSEGKAQRLVKDYQLKIRVEQFENREAGVAWAEKMLNDIAASIKLPDFDIDFSKGVETIFHEQRYDTENDAFAKNYITTRVRHFESGEDKGKSEMSFKFNSLDNEYARNAPCSCAEKWLSDGSCKRKLEQDVHQNFIKTACTSKIVGLDGDFNVTSVQELEGYFDQVSRFVGVDRNHKLKLWDKAKANNYFWRVEDIPMRIGDDLKVDATLKLRYESQDALRKGIVKPADGEFKFKIKGPKLKSGDPFPAKMLSLATDFYNALLKSKDMNIEFGHQPCRFGWGPGYVVDAGFTAIQW